jgi:hypothetical protein
VKVKKDGRRRGRQKYRCTQCGLYFSSKRKESLSWVRAAYEDYSRHKQTYAELSEKYGKDPKTLRRLFDAHAGATGEVLDDDGPTAVILDATFFGRGYGFLMARSPSLILCWQEISTESLEEYGRCLDQLDAMGRRPSAFVIDGRPGVRQLLLRRHPGVPVQFCQFHQIQIVKRHIPARAKTGAARELRRLCMGLAEAYERTFESALGLWHGKYGEFLKEKSPAEGGRGWRYTHRRLRSAYMSIKRNLPYLFTFQKHPGLKIPNTTNHCDGLFAHIKQKVLIHRGISKKRRKKMIDYLLENF